MFLVTNSPNHPKKCQNSLLFYENNNQFSFDTPLITNLAFNELNDN